jgi:hypothetical protein
MPRIFERECPETGDSCRDGDCSVRHCKQASKRLNFETEQALAKIARVAAIDDKLRQSRDSCRSSSWDRLHERRLNWAVYPWLLPKRPVVPTRADIERLEREAKARSRSKL